MRQFFFTVPDSSHELTGPNGGEIKISERSDLDRARRIAYILSHRPAD
jgi:hypothetical protein